MYSNRRPYYGLKLSIADFFREPVRYLKQSNTQESMMEKPYLVDEYPKMHLSPPDFKYKPKERSGLFGSIASGVPPGGLAIMDYGEAGCGWGIINPGSCIDEPIVITMFADYFLHAEFDFVVQGAESTIDVILSQLPGTEAFGWDEQNYLLTFPENANGSVTICGFASTNTLISQTFETVVAGMPVGIYKYGDALAVRESGQAGPAVLLKSSYGVKGSNCGCIELSSNCLPVCGCKSIGYTTQQMVTDEVQGLSVVDPVGGCTYSWSIDSGDGSLSSPTGTSVNYTAPSTNAECANNPTIILSVGGIPCDSLQMSVNAYTSNTRAYWETDRCDCDSYPGTPGAVYCFGSYYNCDSVFYAGDGFTCYYGSQTEPPCGTICDTCATPYTSSCTPGDAADMRSAYKKTEGCCPAGLLL
ncbi:hypothetical protein KA005_29100 [bacterium]|nr:hypothetical protein [bacterium]